MNLKVGDLVLYITDDGRPLERDVGIISRIPEKEWGQYFIIWGLVDPTYETRSRVEEWRENFLEFQP